MGDGIEGGGGGAGGLGILEEGQGETDCPAGLSVLFQGSAEAPRWRPQINLSLRLA